MKKYNLYESENAYEMHNDFCEEHDLDANKVNVADVVIKNGWVCVDMFIECKRLSTAVRRWAGVLDAVADQFPDFEGWGETFRECFASGCNLSFHESNEFHGEMENNDESLWYAYLNLKRDPVHGVHVSGAPTKDDERETLNRIRAEVAALGADSYVGAAFAGCFELAETNIDNDFLCSMQERAEAAERRADRLAEKVDELRSELAEMQKAAAPYDYRASMADDIREEIQENLAYYDRDLFDDGDEIDRDDLREKLYDDFFVDDAVTGNASGSYWFNSWKAERAVSQNMDLLSDALREFGQGWDIIEDGFESCDVTIRCYLLGEILDEVIDELSDDELREMFAA